MREYIFRDEQRRFEDNVLYYAHATRQEIDLLALLEVVHEASSDDKKEAAAALVNKERQPFDWRNEIESTFVDPKLAGRGWYRRSSTRIFECVQLLWSACRRDEYVPEAHAGLVTAIRDGLWLQGRHERRGTGIHEHALALVVGSIFAGQADLLGQVSQVAKIDPPENLKYPLYETLASFLVFASNRDWQSAEKLISALSKFKMKFRPRVPTGAMLRAMCSQNRKQFDKAMREIHTRHEATLREFGHIYVNTPERFEFDFGGLHCEIRIPNIDISCVLVMSRLWPDLQPDSFWIPERLLEGRFD